MAEEGLWVNQSLGLMNSNSSGNIIPTANTSTAVGTETKDLVMPPPPPPTAQPAAAQVLGKKRGRDSSEMNKSKKAKQGGSSDQAGDGHENHILTERERRKRMRDMFANLHALIPSLTKKADKSTIVDEAVAYIKSLQSTLDDLEKKKQERLQLGATLFSNDQSMMNPNHQIMMTMPYKTREAFLADQVSSSNTDGSLIIPSANSSLNSLPNQFPVAFQVWTSPNVVLTICGDEAQFSVCSPKKFGTLSFILFVLEKYNIEVLTATVSSEGNRNIFLIQTRARGAQDQMMELIPVEDIYRRAADEIMQWTISA